MRASEERIAELRVEFQRRQELFDHARRELYLAKAALAEAEGDEFFARWDRALAANDSTAVQRCETEWANRKQEQGAQP